MMREEDLDIMLKLLDGVNRKLDGLSDMIMAQNFLMAANNPLLSNMDRVTFYNRAMEMLNLDNKKMANSREGNLLPDDFIEEQPRISER